MQLTKVNPIVHCNTKTRKSDVMTKHLSITPIDSFAFDKFGRIRPTEKALQNTEPSYHPLRQVLDPNGNDNLLVKACKEFNETLALTILPTEKCNFKCPYCFENFEFGVMSPAIVNGIKNLIANRVTTDLINLKVMWYGGEPMLGYSKIIEIMEHVNTIKTPQLSLYSDITTNGYFLTKDKFAQLVNLGVKNYQITFDGNREEHNKLRLSRDGKPTFDIIWGNIIATKETDLDFTMKVRMHINRNNKSSMIDLLRRFESAISGDKRFEFNIRGLMRLGKNDAALPLLDAGSNSISEVADFARSLNLKVSPREAEYTCYATSPNTYLIRPNGELLKCGVHLYDHNNSVGQLNSDGTLTLDTYKELAWNRGLFSGIRKELACPAINFPKSDFGDGIKLL